MKRLERIGWIAGFLEGRGFSIRNGRHHKHTNRVDMSLQVQTTQPNKFPLFKKFAKLVDCKFYKSDTGLAFAERSIVNNRPVVYTDGRADRYSVKLGARKTQKLIAEIGHLLDSNANKKLKTILDTPVLSPREAALIASKISADKTRLPPSIRKQRKREAQARYELKRKRRTK